MLELIFYGIMCGEVISMKVELIGGLTVLSDLTREEKNRIKDDLTLPNPAYIQAKAYSRFPVKTIPRDLFFFSQIGKSLLVPRGYKVPFKPDSLVDNRVSVAVPYPKLQIGLRATQQVAYNHWRKDTDKGVTVLPTGKGKSIYGAYLAYSKRQRCLIVVQKNDLVDGWKKDIKTMFKLRSSQIGIIKAGTFRIGKQYTITTIQTLSSLPPEKMTELYSTFGMIIVDEFHHSPAVSYTILKMFKAKYYVGLTATDMREDGLQKVLYWMFGDVCYRHKVEKDDEDIMSYSVKLRTCNIEFNPPDEYTMYKGKRKRKPTNIHVIRQYVNHNSEFNNLVANDIVSEFKDGKSCVALFHEKDHIRYMQELLEKKGVPSSQIQLYYGDSKESDSVMKERAENKTVLITLATFSKATEGTNVKAWEREFLVGSLNNKKGVIQAVGRILRRKTGKKDAIVYDYRLPNVKSLRNHGTTRNKAYKETKGTIIGKVNTKPPITRGWKRTI